MNPVTLPVVLLYFGLTLLITASGFRRVVYFVSVGYAFAIAAMAIATGVIFLPHFSAFALIHSLLLLFWGLRLGIFLLRREKRPSFQKPSQEVTDQYGSVEPLKKLVIWLGVSVLYVSMFLPGLYGAAEEAVVPSMTALAVQIIGMLLMAAGLILEATADRQKSAFKARRPQSFCDAGLYGLVRCPNYLGEILFWVGNWVMGIAFYAGLLQWLVSLAGTVVLVLIMLGSTRRLERSQELRYGNLAEYQTYVRTVPVLFPFIPLYTLKNIHVYLE